MKKLLIIITFSFTAAANAQKVGIGAPTPNMKLHISSPDDTALLQIDNNTALANNTNVGMYFKNGSYFTGAIKAIGTGGNAARMSFHTFAVVNQNQLLERMSILDNGNVGIGTSTPLSKLNVKTNSYGFIHSDASDNVQLVTFVSASGGWLGTKSNHPLHFFTNDGLQQVSLLQNGNFGIGTTNPAARLEINGQIKITGGSPGAGKFLETDASGLASWVDVSASLLPTGLNGNTLRHNGTSWITTSTLFNNGTNIGIGTSSPLYILDINGRTRFRHNGVTSGLWLNKSDNTEGAFIGMINDSTAGLWGNNTGGNWKVGIDVKNGLVGVGLTDPSAPLSFALSGGNKIALYGDASAGHYGLGIGTGLLQMYSASSSTDIAFGYGNSSSFTENAKFFGSGNMHLGKYVVWSGASDDRKINIGDGDFVYLGETNADDRLTLRAGSFDFKNGDVYIGATDFNKGSGYKLRVNGKIISEEVRVQVLSAWPDYVFSKDYNKLTIPQLEEFVKSNKHLPGMPSAVEVEKDGQLLGDIQRKMMEKIEELTLYIIELNNKLAIQQEEISKLKK